MRRAVTACIAVAIAGLVALGVAAAAGDDEVAFTIGVDPGEVAAELDPGQTVCQGPILVTNEFDSVGFPVGTFQRPGQVLAVAVRDGRDGSPLGGGTVPAGYADGSEQKVEVTRLGVGEVIEVCIQNRDATKAAIYGVSDPLRDPPLAVEDGRTLPSDLALRFFTSDAPSLAGLLPEMVSRAALFDGGLVGEWTIWLILALVAAAVPVLLALALRDAERE